MDDARPVEPVSGIVLPRFSGIATFMRLPYARPTRRSVDIGLIGVPWDGGTTNRAGARHGPREIRDQSSLMRRVHPRHPHRALSTWRGSPISATCRSTRSTSTDTLARIEQLLRRACTPPARSRCPPAATISITLPILRGDRASGGRSA